MKTWTEMMCSTLPVDWGGYTVTRNQSLAPDSIFEQEQATRIAMVSSWKENQEVLSQQMAEAKRQKNASDAAIRAQGQQAVRKIQAIGERATIRNNAVQSSVPFTRVPAITRPIQLATACGYARKLWCG